VFDLTDFQSYQDYFAAIAAGHVDISGYLFGDEGVPNNDLKAWPRNQKKLWLEPYAPTQVIGPNVDNMIKQKAGVLMVGGPVADNKFSTSQQLFKACEIIVEQIIAKMDLDLRAGTLLTSFASLKYGQAEHAFSATRLVGCRLDFTFQDPSGFVYDENKWQ
jgi:hypothetical protein